MMTRLSFKQLIFSLIITALLGCVLLHQSVRYSFKSKRHKYKVQPECNVHYRDNLDQSENDHSFVLSPNTMCDKNTQIFIAVLSKANERERRHIIRQTWGSYARWYKTPLRLAFFMGKDINSTNVNDLKNEFYEFGDIVMDTSYMDTYRCLPMKVISAMQWTMQNCNMAMFYMKVDSDVFLNPRLLFKTLGTMDSTEPFIMGDVVTFGRAIRKTTDKWYVSTMVYPPPIYPNYTNGPAYVMSMPALKLLVQEAENDDSNFPMEDVYITGILAERLGIPRVRSHLMHSFRHWNVNYYISIHNVKKSREMAKYWNLTNFNVFL